MARHSAPRKLGAATRIALALVGAVALSVPSVFASPGGEAARVAVGASGTIVATADGGKTWTTRTSGTTLDLRAVSCAGAQRCVAVGNYAGSTPAVILATQNGGATWTVESSGVTDTLFSVSCPSATMCVATGQGGEILTTNDGGATWHERTTNTDAYLQSVSCSTTSRCVAAGFYVATAGVAPGSWAIVASKDGGATWASPAKSSIAGVLYGEMLTRSVSCPTSNTCFVLGGGNLTAPGDDLLATHDGGATWSRASGPKG